MSDMEINEIKPKYTDVDSGLSWSYGELANIDMNKTTMSLDEMSQTGGVIKTYDKIKVHTFTNQTDEEINLWFAEHPDIVLCETHFQALESKDVILFIIYRE